ISRRSNVKLILTLVPSGAVWPGQDRISLSDCRDEARWAETGKSRREDGTRYTELMADKLDSVLQRIDSRLSSIERSLTSLETHLNAFRDDILAGFAEMHLRFERHYDLHREFRAILAS